MVPRRVQARVRGIAVRALQAELSDRVYVHGDAPDFVWFRVRDPDGYPIEVYWEDSAQPTR